MQHPAPPLLHALETSGFAAAIRESVWIYPFANVTHVVAVMAFFAAVVLMDVRLLGWLWQVPPLGLVRSVRRFAVPAFVVVLATGFALFAAEASHVGLNWMFQLKMALVALGLANIVVFELLTRSHIELEAGSLPPASIRASAFLSLVFWLAVAVCGRSIAYV